MERLKDDAERGEDYSEVSGRFLDVPCQRISSLTPRAKPADFCVKLKRKKQDFGSGSARDYSRSVPPYPFLCQLRVWNVC